MERSSKRPPRRGKKKLTSRPYKRECAWCKVAIPEDSPVVGFGGRARAGADLRSAEGRIISIHLTKADTEVAAIVTPPDSPARRAGHELYFMTCGDECASALQLALRFEIGRRSEPPGSAP